MLETGKVDGVMDSTPQKLANRHGGSRDQIRDLFTICLGQKPIDLSREDHVLIACCNFDETPMVSLVKWDKPLMAGSVVCSKLAQVIDDRALIDITGFEHLVSGAELLTKPIVVICVSAPVECFTEGYIETIEDFYNFVVLADQLALNIPYACSKTDRMIWLMTIKERAKDVWRCNEVLLSNIEQKIFDKPKFGPAPAAPIIAVAAGYPQAGTPSPNFITMKEIPKMPFLPQESFVDLLSLLLRNEATDFVSKLISVIGSSLELYENVFTTEILSLITDLPVFPSTAFYAFRIMFLEELAMYYGKRGPGRFILPLDTVSKMPAEATSAKDTSLGNFTTSPWLGILAQKMCLTNGLTLPAMLVGERRACSLTEFDKRLFQYTNGIFEHLKWANDSDLPKYRTALTGSTMAACAIKNPLETSVDSFAEYIAEYYPGRTRTSVKKSTAYAMNDNMMTFFTNDSLDPITEAEEAIMPDNTGPVDYTDMDLMVECRLEDFDAVAESHYKNIKKAAEESASLLWPADEVIMEYVKTENKHKYIIRGLPREIDIFHVDSIEAVIVKYHLGCVRLWYDGSQVWCLPSFVTAANLGLNLDIRWVSNKKDVRDTVLKYFQRGFGTLINRADRENLIDYVNNSAVWPHIVAPAPANGWMARRAHRRFFQAPMFGSVFHQMFNPSASRMGIHYSLPTAKRIVRKVVYDVPANETYHRRRAGPNGSMKNCDFKTYAGRGLLPAQCSSLQPYF